MEDTFTIQDEAHAELTALTLIRDEAAEKKLRAEIEEEAAKATARLMPLLTELQDKQKRNSAALAKWVEPQLSAKVRSVVVGAARIGLRSSESLEFKAGEDEKTVVEKLEAVIEKGEKAKAPKYAQALAAFAKRCVKYVAKLSKTDAKKVREESDEAATMLAQCGLKLVEKQSLTVAHA